MSGAGLLLWVLAADPAFAGRCEATLAAARAAPTPGAAALAAGGLTPPEEGRLPALDEALKRLAESDAQGHGQPEARAALEDTLAATCAQARLASGSAPAADRAALTEILARPQFAGRKAQGWGLGRVLERLWDVIKEFLQARGFVTFTAIYRSVFLAVVALLSLWAGLRLYRARRAGPIGLEAPLPSRRRGRDPSAEELEAQARAALEAGQPAEAMRLALLALLADLDRRGLADRHAGRTNRELAEDLARRAPASAEQARKLLGWFDRAFYGQAALARTDAEAFARDLAALRAGLPSGAAP